MPLGLPYPAVLPRMCLPHVCIPLEVVQRLQKLDANLQAMVRSEVESIAERGYAPGTPAAG